MTPSGPLAWHWMPSVATFCIQDIGGSQRCPWRRWILCGCRSSGPWGSVVISHDRHFLTRPGERELYRQHGLRSFWIAGKKDPPMSNWAYLRRLLKHLALVEHRIATRGRGPWSCAIFDRGISDVTVK